MHFAVLRRRYTQEMIRRGCTLDLSGAAGGGGHRRLLLAILSNLRRRLQEGYLTQYVDVHSSRTYPPIA